MESTGSALADGDGGLRDRHQAHGNNAVSSDSNPAHNTTNSDQARVEVAKQKKTYGRTPESTVFVVPQTHDMVSQLLSPSQPKNFGDLAVLLILAVHILLLYLLPSAARIPVFAIIFLTWRAGYNVGIGYLLHVQSKHRRLVGWAKKLKLFVDPKKGDNPHPLLYYFMKTELERKIPEDYKFENVPVEYNTWLVFRRIVDLILMCDFVSYCLFAIANGSRPESESLVMTAFRWITGLTLVGFNLWVKLDAHRVVKDYAWYWGDFFYLIDQELTFDGVFEMAPHPMYSVGYAGYYGISLMAASYNVLFISIIAHAAQFAFLVWVENPHIEKTYNPPIPRKMMESNEGDEVDTKTPGGPKLASSSKPSPVHDMLGIRNMDLCRIADTSIVLLCLYMGALTLLTPETPVYQALFVVNAVLWRMWFSLGIGYVLDRQSNKKKWTRHFVKYGESKEEAWRQWKGLYHLSTTMCYASFIAATWKAYSLPPDWNTGLVLLKHVLGAGLVCLHVWTSVSIYDSLGEFGWFFGDFFFDQAPKLTYSGIYRFLNNPERILGLAGLWGAVLFTGRTSIFFLALLSHVLSLIFIQFVERPHMQKLYGQSLRRESGLSKSIKRSLPPPLRLWQGNVDKVFSEGVDAIENFIDAARPKLTASLNLFVNDSTALLKSGSRIGLPRLESDLAGFNPTDYSLSISGTQTEALVQYDPSAPAPRVAAENKPVFDSLAFAYGSPIQVTWTAPLNHSKKDWIGLYMVSDNSSREATHVASSGRWVPTNKDQYDNPTADAGILTSDVLVSRSDLGNDSAARSHDQALTGTVIFSGDKLWWTTGVFEFRYHHNGKHNVMAISRPFEISFERFSEDDVVYDTEGSLQTAVEQALLPLVRDCFDRDDDLAPGSVSERWGGMVERDDKYAKRVVYAVGKMFGVEFAPAVVRADGCVKNLAWRICEARKVLAPYSMSPSRGNTTPTSAKFE